jgi:hypothetical protein
MVVLVGKIKELFGLENLSPSRSHALVLPPQLPPPTPPPS